MKYRCQINICNFVLSCNCRHISCMIFFTDYNFRDLLKYYQDIERVHDFHHKISIIVNLCQTLYIVRKDILTCMRRHVYFSYLFLFSKLLSFILVHEDIVNVKGKEDLIVALVSPTVIFLF